MPMDQHTECRNANRSCLALIMVLGIHYIDNMRKENNMVGIILLGKSNSGKSTIGKKVAETLGIRYISSGDIARGMNDKKTQEELNEGKLAPEDEMRKCVLAEINKGDSYILDGFPRFYEQYEWINLQISHELVYVFIDASDEDIISRAKSRGRDDDESITKKLEFYQEKTLPMIKEIINGNSETVYIINNDTESIVNNNVLEVCRQVEDYLC